MRERHLSPLKLKEKGLGRFRNKPRELRKPMKKTKSTLGKEK